MSVSARTAVFALLGDPVAHSLSPIIQNAAVASSGVDGVYVALQVHDQGLPHLMRALAEAGGGGNVTLPHKERAASVLDVRSDAVRRTGACNTFWIEEGQVHGDNTDVEGFRRALEVFLGRRPAGDRILLLGAGGAARAALVGLLDDGAEAVDIYNRTEERARAVARRIGGERVRVVPTIEALEGIDYDLVVNSTRLGLDPEDPSPIDLQLLGSVGSAYDMIYGRDRSEFVRSAEVLGIKAADGLEMLVQQGAVAFERWWKQEAPVEAMREAAGSAVMG